MKISQATTALALTVLAASLAALGPGWSHAADPADDGVRVAIAGAPAPGPARFNQLWIRKHGPRDAVHVLVLVPGSAAGQGSYDALAPALVQRVRNLAVWTVDRRENALEDVSVMRDGDPAAAVDYYLDPPSGFQPWTGETAGFAREWGAAVQLEDLRRVVLAARDGGRRGVMLGGHGTGAALAATYAAWDFTGAPGHLDLEALVLIDGGPFNALGAALPGPAFAAPWATVADARAALTALALRSPFGAAGAPAGAAPWALGVLAEIACQYALRDPGEPSALQPSLEPLQSAGVIPAGLVPAGVVPAFPVTNEAFAGLLFASGAYPALDARVGRLAFFGSPRAWRAGPLGGVDRACTGFAREPGNGLEWYYPLRLDMDLLLALPSLRPTPVTEHLGLRPYHLADIHVPLYAIQTGLSQGGVLRAAGQLVEASRIRQVRFVSEPAMGHLDPLVGVPEANRFVATVVPFLRELTGDPR